MRPSPHRNNRGFSLVELAMVIAIAGLMVSFGLQAKQAAPVDCYPITKQQLSTIRTAVETFARTNDRLPLPANMSVGVEDITYGREGNTGTVTGTATWGALPFQALGLAPSYAADCWGNKLAYVVTTALTTNAQVGGFRDTTVLGTIALEHTTTPPAASTNTAYAIISFGEDGLGAVKADSSNPPWCTSNGNIGTVNCSAASATVADAVFNDGGKASSNASYFDDVILASAKPLNIKTNVYCWGWDGGNVGALGDGVTTSHSNLVPTRASGLAMLAKFSNRELQNNTVGGTSGVCGLDKDGAAWCWGSNTSNYSIGDGTTNPATAPKKIGGSLRFKNLFQTFSYSLALGLTDNKLYCWGVEYGACWDAENGSAITTPRAFIDPPLMQYPVITDNHFGAGLGTDNNVYTWGTPGAYKGLGAVNNTQWWAAPHPVTGNHQFSKLVGSPWDDGNYCALTMASDPAGADHVFCWGNNTYGELGLGDQVPRQDPTMIPGHTFSNIFAAQLSMYGVGDAADANPGRTYAWGSTLVGNGNTGTGGVQGTDWGVSTTAQSNYTSVTNIPLTGSPVTITTGAPHGLNEGDLIGFYTDPSLMQNIYSSPTSHQYNGTYMAHVVDATHIQLENTDGSMVNPQSQYLTDPVNNPFDATVSITSITQANPAVVTTATPHGFTNGQVIAITGVQGMTTANTVNNSTFSVSNVTPTTFQLNYQNSTNWPAYTGSGSVGQYTVVAKKPTGCYYQQPGGWGICIYSPKLMDNPNTFVQIQTTSNANIGLDSNGVMWGWGIDWNGSIDPTTVNTTYPSPHRVAPAGPAIRKIASFTYSNVCALDVNKQIYCWGGRSDANGNGTNSGYGSTTVPIAGGHQWIDVTAMEWMSCGLTFDPNVDCDNTTINWGSCSATSPAMLNGASQIITNTVNGHSGSITMSCSNKVLTQTGGTCQ